MAKINKKDLNSVIGGDEKPASTIVEKLKGASPYLGFAAFYGGASAYEFSQAGTKIPAYVKEFMLVGPVEAGIMGAALSSLFLGLSIYSMYSVGKKYKKNSSGYKTE